MNIQHDFFKFSQSVKYHAPEILTVCSVIGTIATVFFTAKATLKVEEIYKEESNQGLEPDDPDMKEVVKRSIPHVILPLSLAAGTVACTIGANVTNRKQQATLIGACTTAEAMLAEIKSKLTDEEKKRINQEIAEDNRPENLESPKDDDDTPLFYDEYRHEYFTLPMEEFNNARYRLNRNLQCRFDVSLNEWWAFLGLSLQDFGEYNGWDWDMLNIAYGMPWVDIEAVKIVNDDGFTYYAIDYGTTPPTNPANVNGFYADIYRGLGEKVGGKWS